METEEIAATFAALGQGTRLELLRVLLAAGPTGLAAGEAAARLSVPSSTLSFHLRAMEQAGLVAATRQGRSLIYAVQIERLRRLIAFLVEPCCEGEPERCGDLNRLLYRITTESPMSRPAGFSVLFLCTRNSARSIIAEAILSKLAPGRFVAYSAGSNPAAEGPMPEVLSQLQALGHDVSGLKSKSWDSFTGAEAPKMDFVITLCDMVAGQTCPDFEGVKATAAWPLPDPAKFSGSAAERATMLNELYAGLRRRLEIFTSLPFAALDQMALKARIDELADPLVQAR